MSRALFAASLLCLGVLGCHPSSAQRLAESANNLNMAARFGRMDMAAELIAAKSHEDFTKRHAAWGGSVRLVDIEIDSMVNVNSNDADVTVAVSWTQPNDTTLRATELKQRWHDTRGTWKLVSEARLAGDYGLFGDVAPPAPAAASAESDRAASAREAQFRTRVIAGDSQ